MGTGKKKKNSRRELVKEACEIRKENNIYMK